jgi:hypothetical protein
MMAGLHRAALALILASYSFACATWVPPVRDVPATADVMIAAVASVADAAISFTLAAFEAEGLAVVAALPITGDAAKDEAAKRVAFEVLDARWAPAWKAWEHLREANDAVLAARALGEAPDLVTLERAYCALRVTLPSSARAELPSLRSCS